MQQNRRAFIKTTAQTLAVTFIAGNVARCNSTSSIAHGNISTFGLQLYSVRDDLIKDVRGVLRKVAQMGYKQIESYDGPMGIYWGMKHTEFKKYMDDLGMRLVSSHCTVEQDFQKTVDAAAAVGIKYLIEEWIGPKKKIDEFKRIADQFNEYGAVCKRAGLRFAYHNHDYTFDLVEGQLPQDVLMRHTDRDLVDFQMDIYWMVTAGEDPVKWVEKYPGRFKLCHVKDRKKNVPLSNKEAFSVLGKGQIDFASVLTAGRKNGMEYFVVEQDMPDGMSALQAAKMNADFMKRLKV